MKLPTYAEILKGGKTLVDATLIPIRAAQAKKIGELEVMKLEEQILTLEGKITELAIDKDINYKAIADKIDELDLLKRRQGQFNQIIEDLFGTPKRGK